MHAHAGPLMLKQRLQNNSYRICILSSICFVDLIANCVWKFDNPIIYFDIHLLVQVICFPIVQCFSQFSFSAFKGNSFVVLQWTPHLACSALDFEVYSESLMELEATSQPQIHLRLVTIAAAAAAAVLKQSTTADPKKNCNRDEADCSDSCLP